MAKEADDLSRDAILNAVESYTIIESYPEDKYLPSYLVAALPGFHVLFAIDVGGDNARVVTAYRPDPGEWAPPDFTKRRKR